MIHGPGQAGPWIDRWLNSSFENPLRSETRLTKIDETQQQVASWRRFSRKRIELRSVRFKISNSNSRKLQVFVSHENLRLSEEMSIRTILVAILRRYRKFSILATCCWRHSNFLNLCKAIVGITAISSELLLDFRSSNVCWSFGKRQVLRHVEEVWTFA